MSDAADKSTEDHWARLASELGLEGEPNTSPNRPAPRREPADDPAESTNPHDEEFAAPPRGRRRRSASEREADTTALSEGEPPAEPDLVDVEPPPEKPRRGRKSANAEADVPVDDRDESTASAEEAPESPKEEAPKRRRRRRSRKRRSGEPPETVAAEAAESTDPDEDTSEVEAAPEPAEDDEPAPEVIADWNVPSWNDLIASLYRPDR